MIFQNSKKRIHENNQFPIFHSIIRKIYHFSKQIWISGSKNNQNFRYQCFSYQLNFNSSVGEQFLKEQKQQSNDQEKFEEEMKQIREEKKKKNMIQQQILRSKQLKKNDDKKQQFEKISQYNLKQTKNDQSIEKYFIKTAQYFEHTQMQTKIFEREFRPALQEEKVIQIHRQEIENVEMVQKKQKQELNNQKQQKQKDIINQGEICHNITMKKTNINPFLSGVKSNPLNLKQIIGASNIRGKQSPVKSTIDETVIYNQKQFLEPQISLLNTTQIKRIPNNNPQISFGKSNDLNSSILNSFLCPKNTNNGHESLFSDPINSLPIKMDRRTRQKKKQTRII